MDYGSFGLFCISLHQITNDDALVRCVNNNKQITLYEESYQLVHKTL